MQKLIQEIIKCANQEKKSPDFLDFVQIFYLQNQERDFALYSIGELCNNIIPSFDFFQNKKSLQFKVKFYNGSNGYDIIDIVNDDMPFLVDSIAAQITKLGIEIKNVMHPLYEPSRDKSGVLQHVVGDKKSIAESFIQFHINKINEAKSQELVAAINIVLENVKFVVDDFKSMIKLVEESQKHLKKIPEITEIKDFLNWINQGNFILLGAQEFNYIDDTLRAVESASFGIFRSVNQGFKPNTANASPREIADVIANPYVLEIVKSSYKSQIHRGTNAERIRVQKFSSKGVAIGEFRIIGLFTSLAYSSNPLTIPLVKNKIAQVLEKSSFVKGSHNYKDLVSVLESYPRDELFQIDAEDLLRISTGIVAICGRNQLRFFARKDKFSRFISCLIFVPRDRSSSELRVKIGSYLEQQFGGKIADFFVQITESNLNRLHLIIKTEKPVELEESRIESEIAQMIKPWCDFLKEEISTKFGNENSANLFAKYHDAFSINYQNDFDARRAAIDISRIEEAIAKNSVLFNLYNSSTTPKEIIELKIYSPTRELILSDVMPILESFGFNVIHENVYKINVAIDNAGFCHNAWIHYFRLNLSHLRIEFSESLKKNFEEAISLIWADVMSAGSLNRLIVSANLNWKQVYMMRGYTKYLYQAGFRHDQKYVATILVKNTKATHLLVELFEAKFDPTIENRDEKILVISEKIKALLSSIQDASHDLTIRKFFAIINASLRTNYYQTVSKSFSPHEPCASTCGDPQLPQDNNNCASFKGYLSFKFDCKKVPDLPLPLPYAEIFVYSNQMQGVHLRGGKVARGGLRWSDRHEDFRTEILGLVKAQMTKNAVIVPVGSKGGFVVKKDATKLSREEYLQEGIACYKTFLSGLLDLTDNVVEGKIVHPQNVVMHDGTDPYLVVAADKGTATFSDIANSVSKQYNFWLGDAFASGGSAGYDHKKMGITAKGAWISVMRHFREMGVDTQAQDFTCVGIGDLSGDVFGNGMLLSPHIKLVAAFNHMHIFLDPNPDAAHSFVERQRMFNLPRSTWMDYNNSLISQGGGIFERSAKSIKISPEIKQLLEISADELTPNELLRFILKSNVDLLWNGGIGTYFKAADESHLDVGDRTNDAIRINGDEIRAKVVGEGGNLGFTQKGRIEYALNGGRINTDALDNSAGVDCSDHEVNIKIALIQAMRAGKINLQERDQILESMTDNVAKLVLEDNRLQSQIITIVQSQGASILGMQEQFLDRLEKSGLLNRAIEFLPSKKEIAKRQIDKIGLTRPELCVMLAYSKMNIYNELIASNLVDDKYFTRELFSYFPQLMQQKFADEIANHQLRREIIATQITNFAVNRVGISFINRIAQESGFSIVDVVKSFIIACDAFGLRETWQEVENADSDVASHIQMQMFLSAHKLLERSMLWVLHSKMSGDLSPTLERLRKIVVELSKMLGDVLAKASRDSYERKAERYILNNVNNDLSHKIASMDALASAFDIAAISDKSRFDLKTIAKIYFIVGSRFSLKWLRAKLSDMAFESYWQKLSSKTIIEDLYSFQMKISAQIVDFACKDEACDIDAVDNWSKNFVVLIERFDNFIDDLKSHPNPDIAMFVVALNRLKPLVG